MKWQLQVVWLVSFIKFKIYNFSHVLRKVVVGDLGKKGPVGSTGESVVDAGSLWYIERQLTFTVVFCLVAS